MEMSRMAPDSTLMHVPGSTFKPCAESREPAATNIMIRKTVLLFISVLFK